MIGLSKMGKVILNSFIHILIVIFETLIEITIESFVKSIFILDTISSLMKKQKKS